MSHREGPWGDPRVRFWTREAHWFVDSHEHFFLARAVHMLGQAHFGSEWTGAEPSTPWRSPLPETWLNCDEADWSYAQRLLFEYNPEYRARAIEAGNLFLPVPTLEEWKQAYDLSRALADATQASFERFVVVAGLLVKHFEAGTLPTGVREEEGGKVHPLDRHFWNGESMGTRFRCCRIHPARPFTWETVERGGLLIFVEKGPFLEFLARYGDHQKVGNDTNPEPQQPTRKRSPYLRLVDDVIEALDLDCDNFTIKKQTIIEELKSRWPTDFPSISRNMLETLATAMRSPEAQRGGAKRSRNSQG